MNKIIFILPENEITSAGIIDTINVEKGNLAIRKFPDGESLVKINSDVRNKGVFVFCTLQKPDDKILMLYFVCNELKKRGAKKITLVSPYLSYMRQDTEFNPGEVVTADHFAALISTFTDHLITIDPHLHRKKSLNEIYPIKTTALHSAPLISDYIKTTIKNPVLIGPDEESEQWVSEIAKKTDAPCLVFKKNRSADRIVNITIPPMDKYINHTPVIMDDIISTAHTMIETVKKLNTSGMKVPVCIGVHAVFSGNAYEELKICGVEKIITCNTIPHITNEIDVSELIIQQIKENDK